MQDVYGWQSLALRQYPELGYRLLGNCDVPDLALFPARYHDLENIRFRAGLETSLLHFGLWMMSWLVRLCILKSLAPFAAPFLKASRLFDGLGSDESALHMEMSGVDKKGHPKTVIFYLVAKSGDGPFIPSIPSILCTKMLAHEEIKKSGAYPCIGIISLEQYMEALKGLAIISSTRSL